MAPPRSRQRPPRTPTAALVRILWVTPLTALPFALFFLLLNAAPWRQLPDLWLAAMMFALPIGLANWAIGSFLAPVIQRRFAGDVRGSLWTSGMHFVGSLVASLGSIVLLGLTIAPDFLAHGRAVIIALAYSTLFSVLFLGVALTLRFYQQAVAHAGSDRELQLARRIQRSFLLSEFPHLSGLDVHAVNLSSKEVSGDFYDVVAAGDDALLIAVADVSGKGVPAALLSSMIQASLRTQADAAVSTAAMAAIINRLACQRDTTGQFATMFLALVDGPTQTLRYTNAGHNFPVLLRADGTLLELPTGGLLAGMIPGIAYDEACVPLRSGDRLVIYTDGVTEAFNAEGVMFGEERLVALLRSLPAARTAQQDVDAVTEGVLAFLGDVEPGDDITVLVLRVTDGGTARPTA